MTEAEKKFPKAHEMLRRNFLEDIDTEKKADQIPGTQILGKFKLFQKIGKGAAADVFLAEDTLVNRRVALKVLTRFHPQDFERFKRESKVAAKLNHPNIVQLYEVGELQGLNYISMQYIEGGSVQDKNLTLVQALKTISTIARAVEYAHNQGVIHRDIKPANILVDHEGKGYLADFGIAKSLTLQSVGKTLSVTGMIIGTPNFMSPEQARGDITKVDFLSDVYSLGATLYYLVTGKEPYQGTSVMEIINKVINEDAPPPRFIKKDIPQEVEAIILKAIEKDKQRRYQRAVDLAKDIERFLRGEPVEAKVPNLSTRLRKQLKKYKTSIVIGIMLLALVSYLGTTTLMQQNRFNNYKSRADDYFAKGNLDKALEYYFKCREIKENSEIQSQIALINDKKHRLSGALKSLDSALSLYGRYKKILYDQTADVEEIRKIALQLIKYLDESIQQYPLANAYYHRGKVYRELTEFENAEKDLSSAIELDKNFDLARLERIMLYWDIYSAREMHIWASPEVPGEHKKFREKIKIDMGNINLANLPEDEVELVKSILSLSDSIFYMKDYDKTLQDLENAFERFKDEEFYYLMGLLYNFTRKYEKADEYQTKAIDRRPFFPKAYFIKAKSRERLGENKEAIDGYTKAITQAPGYALAYLERSRLYIKIGEYEKAEFDCKHLLKTDGSNYDYLIYEILGIIYSKRNLHDDAIGYFNKSLSINPRWTNALTNRSIAYLKKNDIANAFRDINSAIDIGIDIGVENGGGYQHRGLLYFYTKQLEPALADINKAVDLFKSTRDMKRLSASHLFRGIVYFEMKQYDNAIVDFNEAIRLEPSLETQARQYIDKIKELKPNK